MREIFYDGRDFRRLLREGELGEVVTVEVDDVIVFGATGDDGKLALRDIVLKVEAKTPVDTILE